MSCKHCGSNRSMSVSSHASDLHSWHIPHLNHEGNGYAPQIPGVCYGDDTDITFCLDCGMLHDFTPISDDQLCEILDIELEEYIDDEEEDECEEDEYQEPSTVKYNTVSGPFDIEDLEIFFHSAISRNASEFTFFYIGIEDDPNKKELLKHKGPLKDLIPLLEYSEYVACNSAVPTFRDKQD